MEIPFAQFRFGDEVIVMNEYQFKQALADGRLCKCGSCLACRTVEYYEDVLEEAKAKQPKHAEWLQTLRRA